MAVVLVTTGLPVRVLATVPTFDQFTSFEPGRGYQVYLTAASPVSVVVTGPPVAVAVPLATSSNLIGVASSTQATVSALLAGLQLSTDYDTV